MYDLHPHAPEIKYFQYEKNTCCLSSMSSTLFAANEDVAEYNVVSLL